jgi:hypothetical protein
MSRWFFLVLTTWGLLTASQVQAQLRVVLAAERSSFLLYEPMDLSLQLNNTTGEDVVLNSGEGDRPWLSFIVIDANGRKARSEEALVLEPLVIEPGKTRLMTINLTPLYSIRATGQYQIRASVQLPGRTAYLTDPLIINVGKGEVIWTKSYTDGGTLRTVSLIKFIDRKDVSLFLRVEEPKENLVYTTVRLGNVVALTEPKVELDASRGIHVLHPVGSRLYRYTEADAEGHIIRQEDRASSTTSPALVARPDGKIDVAGGIGETQEVKRARLSDTQQGL